MPSAEYFPLHFIIFATTTTRAGIPPARHYWYATPPSLRFTRYYCRRCFRLFPTRSFHTVSSFSYWWLRRRRFNISAFIRLWLFSPRRRQFFFSPRRADTLSPPLKSSLFTPMMNDAADILRWLIFRHYYACFTLIHERRHTPARGFQPHITAIVFLRLEITYFLGRDATDAASGYAFFAAFSIFFDRCPITPTLSYYQMIWAIVTPRYYAISPPFKSRRFDILKMRAERH